MDQSSMHGSAQLLLQSLSSQEQEQVLVTQLRTWLGTSQLQTQPTLLMLKALAEHWSTDRVDSLLKAITPRYECSWKVTAAMCNLHSAGNRTYARWGISAALVDGKIYLYGGRGKDNRTRGSMHILELNPVSFTQLKTFNAPEPRDGHSCVYHDGKLVVYGGCESGDEDTLLFSKVHSLDISTRTWAEVTVTGEVPPGRDGHASAQIEDVMVVYGGNTAQGICSDILGFYIPRGTWHTYPVEGDSPGCRESMGFTTIGNSLYIFGGNTSPNPGIDTYSNQLYRLTVKPALVDSQLLRPLSTVIPSARLSCSLTAISHVMLVMFGGEGADGFKNDIWVFHLDLGIWSEVIPSKNIEKRIAHIGVALTGKLVIFGGLGVNETVYNEVAVLTLTPLEGNKDSDDTDATQETRFTKPKMCTSCGHIETLCGSNQFSALVYPRFTYCAHKTMHRSVVEQLVEAAPEPCVSLLRLMHPLNSFDVSLTCTLFSHKGPDSHLLSLHSPLICPPTHLSCMLTSSDPANLLIPLLSLSQTSLLLSKTEDYLSIGLINTEIDWTYRSFLVFSRRKELIYPTKDAAERVFAVIFREFGLNQQEIMSILPGFRVYCIVNGVFIIKPEPFISINNSEIALERLFSGYFYSISSNSISINNVKVRAEPGCSVPIKGERGSERYVIRTVDVEDWPFDVRVYSQGVLTYLKLSSPFSSGKHPREESKFPLDILYKGNKYCIEGWERSLEVLDMLGEEEEAGSIPNGVTSRE